MKAAPRPLVVNHSGFPVSSTANANPPDGKTAIGEAVTAQVMAGVDIVTPGQIGWENPLAPIVEGVEGLGWSDKTAEIPGWGKIRLPLVTGPIEWVKPLFEECISATRAVHSGPVKISFGGPYTISRLARDPNRVYGSIGALIEAVSNAMAKEVGTLSIQGVDVIQIEEPHILGSPMDFPRLRESVFALSAAKGSSRLGLMLCGADIRPLYDWLQNLAIDILCLDLVRSSNLVDMINDRETSLVIGLGLPHPDSGEWSAEQIHRALDLVCDGVSAPEIHIHPALSLCGQTLDDAVSVLRGLTSLRDEYLGNQRL